MKYFRNALVRSNYNNNKLDIKEDNSYLVKFYENLLLSKNNNLESDNSIIEELFYEVVEMTIIELLDELRGLF